MRIILYIFLFLSVWLNLSCQNLDKNENDAEAEIPQEIHSEEALERLNYFLTYDVGSENFPRSMEPSGAVRGVASSDWTSGFFLGSLLYAYKLTGKEAYLDKAMEWLPFIEKEKFNGKTHDMGFKVYCSYGNAYEITGQEAYKEVILESASTLSTRFNPSTGCIKSWDFGGDRWQFPVIIDNMMNLELLFEATILSGDSSFHQMATSHAQKTLENHFREDNSSFHVVDYDPQTGEVLQKITHQGYSDNSSWARGQAWGLYGFIIAYRYTKNIDFLNQAESIVRFIFSHPNLPEDSIPYWDFNAPDIPNAPRDVSAAAVCASALIELGHITGDSSYRASAKTIIETLSSEKYLLPASNEVPFILAHSTGNMPKNDEVDVPISYADYYFLESLERLSKW